MVVVLTVAVLVGYRYGITLWNWIKVLIVPAAIAIGVAWLSRAQEREREAAEEARMRREREAQAAQRKRELEVENQRAQDTALQAYLDHMSQLLTDIALHQAQPGDHLSTLARARTLTVLMRLDGVRKGSVLRFLHEAGLIATEPNIVKLRGANLRGTELGGRFGGPDNPVRGVDLRRADLEDVDLSGANLWGPP
jgi:hypothetical protein